MSTESNYPNHQSNKRTGEKAMSNHGEGDPVSAETYNEGAQEFVHEGRVAVAAKEARRALDADPESHRAAEAEGRKRAKEFSREASHPEWFSTTEESTFRRVVDALRRDWKQTLHDLTPMSGEDLDQGFVDTLRQMAGGDAPPIKGEPSGVTHEIQTENFERAVNFGYQAAAHYPDNWSPRIETMLADDWRRSHPLEWPTYQPYVYLGWRSRRSSDTLV